MAQEDDEIDRTIPPGDDDDDAAVIEAIRKAMDGDDDDDIAPVGRAFPELDDAARDEMVTVENGLDLIDSATFGKRPAAKDVDEGDAKATPAGSAAPASDPTPAGDDPYAELLTGISGEQREGLTTRLRDADDMLAIFKGHEDELAAFGTTPKQHIESLVKLNDYAMRNPDKYLAWAATQIGRDGAEDLIIKAAEHLGLKVVREEEDDIFEDEAVKALRAENRALKARNRDLGFSPFEAAPPTQTDLTAWIDAKGSDGQPLRPLFRDLESGIERMAKAHLQQTGKPVTFDDLGRFYDQLTARQRPAPAATEQPAPQQAAAQAQKPVAGVEAKKAADAGSVERAKAASKNLDGSGHGASRRPDALSPDAPLDEVLRHFSARQQG